MATRGLVLYLLSGFSVAVLSVFFFTDPNGNHTYPPSNLSSLNTTLLQYPFPSVSSSSEKVWPVSLSPLSPPFIVTGVCLLGLCVFCIGVEV